MIRKKVVDLLRVGGIMLEPQRPPRQANARLRSALISAKEGLIFHQVADWFMIG